MKRFNRFLQLSLTDKRLLFSAIVLVGAIRAGLWILPFHVLRRLIRRSLRQSPFQPRGTKPIPLEKLAWAIGVASRFVPAASCLTQALATMVLARRSGYQALLRIGVVKNGRGNLLAHAWIESGGEVIIGGQPELGRFQVLTPSREEIL